MLAGGLHLARILAVARRPRPPTRTSGRCSTEVREAITAGSSFADALAQHPHIFDRLYVAVVRAGELSGLPAAGARHPDHLPREDGPAPAQGRRRHHLSGRHPRRRAPHRVHHDRQDRADLRGRCTRGPTPCCRRRPACSSRSATLVRDYTLRGLPARHRWPSCSSSRRSRPRLGRRLFDGAQAPDAAVRHADPQGDHGADLPDPERAPAAPASRCWRRWRPWRA